MDTPLQTALRKAFDSKLSLIAQTLTPEQKAQVVKNLEGTFLPIGGGDFNGGITFPIGSFFYKDAPSNKEFGISGDTRGGEPRGALLLLRNALDPVAGSFLLSTRSADGGMPVALLGETNGRLTWGGKEIVRVESFEDFSNHPSGNSWQHCIRFSNGLQVSYGMYAQEPPPTLGATVTFVLPFIHVPSITLSCFGPDYSGKDLSVHLTNPLNTGFKFWSTWNNWHYWQAFGKWK